jgi:hypothetical protein
MLYSAVPASATCWELAELCVPSVVCHSVDITAESGWSIESIAAAEASVDGDDSIGKALERACYLHVLLYCCVWVSVRDRAGRAGSAMCACMGRYRKPLTP